MRNNMILDLEGSIIYAISANRETTSLVVAGRNVLKILSVKEENLEEVSNLRPGKNLNLNYGALDVAWSQIDEKRIATAATNGTVVVWNLGASGKGRQEITWAAHRRSVNRVCFHGSEPNYVLSASQDCAVKLFDLRNPEHTLQFLSGNESIRDVKFSPTQPYMFAAADEAGNVKLWDLRFIDKPQKIFAAHSEPVFSIDFHPSARSWIATASRDKLIKVWDWGRQVPSCEYAVQTIAPVNVVRWRREREWQLASASLVIDFSIHIWDVRRPFIPFASFDRHKDVPTGAVLRVRGADDRAGERGAVAAGAGVAAGLRLPRHRLQHPHLGRPPPLHPLRQLRPPQGRPHRSGQGRVRVWDWGRQVPSCEYAVQTIAPVNVVRWRREREWQLASASLVIDFSIHIWDVRRPFIPFASFDRHKDVPTGIVWRTHAHSFFSAGKDGVVLENHFANAQRPGDFANPVAVAMSPTGDAAFAVSNKIAMATATKLSPMPSEDGKTTNTTKLFGSRANVPAVGEKGDMFRAPIQSQLVLFLQHRAMEDSASMQWLVETGRGYRLDGLPFPLLCDHNAGVATELGRPHIAASWHILKALFPEDAGATSGDGTSESGEPASPSASAQRSGAVSEGEEAGTSSGAEAEGEEEDSAAGFTDPFALSESRLAFTLGSSNHRDSEPHEESTWGLQSEAFVPRHLENLDGLLTPTSPDPPTPAWPQHDIEEEGGGKELVIQAPAPLKVGRVEALPDWDPHDLIRHMLYFYVESGDIQMTISCLLVLGERARDLIPQDVQMVWYMEYLEVLEQFEEWVTEARVRALCPIPRIQEQSQDGTHVTIGCGRCGKGTGRKGWRCERCGQLTPGCSICGQVVRGLYVWCRGCEHGGHLAHIKDWFSSSHSFCPTGCGHRCEYAFSAHEYA